MNHHYYSHRALRSLGPNWIRLDGAPETSLRAHTRATQQTVWDLLTDIIPERDAIVKDPGRSESGKTTGLQTLGQKTATALTKLREKERTREVYAATKRMTAKMAEAVDRAIADATWDQKVVETLRDMEPLRRKVAIETAARTGDASVVGAIARAPRILEVADEQTIATARDLLGEHLEPELASDLAEATDLQGEIAALFDGAERLVTAEMRMIAKTPEAAAATAPETRAQRAERTRALLGAQQRREASDQANRARLDKQEAEARERIRSGAYTTSSVGPAAPAESVTIDGRTES